MKTIIIPLFDGFIARNILYTSVITELTKRGDTRVVIIPPKGKVELYAKQFENGTTIFVEKGPFWEHDRLEQITEKLFLHSIPTRFMRIRQVDWYWNKGKYVPYLLATTLRYLGHIRLWHRFIRRIDLLLPVQPYIREILDRWQPDCIFAPTMIARDEIALMRLGKKRGAVVVGMVKSWDNLTSKAFLRCFPDRMIVHTEIVKREAIEIYGYPEKNIIVTGLPQYDAYLEEGFTETREAFFKKIGADPHKKLITYAPAGDWMTHFDKEILSRILDWIDEGKLGSAQVLLRLHPTYESQTEELAGRPNLLVERPGKHFDAPTKEAKLRSVEFDTEDMRHLASTMRWSDATINTGSTMTIEAAIFDTPVILIAFDGSASLPYWKSVRRYYDRDHYDAILRSGGTTLVRSFDELKDALVRYLENREVHREGRRRIALEQCYKLDGRSAERVAKAVLEML